MGLGRWDMGIVALCLALPGAAVVQGKNTSLAELLAKPVVVDHAEPATHVPLDQRQGVLFVRARADGVEREFVFDTGSPSMISRGLATQLGLETIGSNTGRDANGAEVTMDFTVLSELEFGGVTFRQVPVLIFDFATLELGSCVFDGGVIGSEILPGSVWRIDAGARHLSIYAPGGAPEPAPSAIHAKLYRLGYPHPPVTDYAIGDLNDKLLFDTGSGEMVTLYEKAADSAEVRAAITPGSIMRGRGTHGTSAGGMGAYGALTRFTLSEFALGGYRLAPVRAATRVVPPSLAGTGLLSTHVVTLDYPAERLTLEKRADPVPAQPEVGYSLAIASGAVRVVQLFDRSAAARAGLQLGDHVVAIGSHRLPRIGPQNICATMRWLAENARPLAVRELTVRREGRELTLPVALP